jgi:hypothetical protein
MIEVLSGLKKKKRIHQHSWEYYLSGQRILYEVDKCTEQYRGNIYIYMYISIHLHKMTTATIFLISRSNLHTNH